MIIDPGSPVMEMIGNFILLMLIVLAIFTVITFVMYVIKSYGTYRILKNNGNDAPWLAWIPVVNKYVYANLASISSNRMTNTIYSMLFTSLYVVHIFFMMSFNLLFIFTGVACYVINIVCVSSIAKASSRSPTKHAIIAVFTMGASIPFQTFSFRNSILTYGVK